MQTLFRLDGASLIIKEPVRFFSVKQMQHDVYNDFREILLTKHHFAHYFFYFYRYSYIYFLFKYTIYQ